MIETIQVINLKYPKYEHFVEQEKDDDIWEPGESQKKRRSRGSIESSRSSSTDKQWKKKNDNSVRKSTKKENKRRSSEESFAYTPREFSPNMDTDDLPFISKKSKKRSSSSGRRTKKEENTTKTVESLLAKNGSKYLVKWKNLSEDENTWEQKTGISKDILKVSDNVNIMELKLINITVLFQYYEFDDI